MRIPTAEDIDAAWFSAMLNSNGIDCEVSAIAGTQVGTGQIGKCVRYELTYNRASADAPATLIGKFPSDDPSSRTTGVVLRNFYKEVCFYQQMQSRLSISTPRCYYADIVDEGPHFAVIMADLAPATQGDQLKGCDATVAKAAVMELVGLHGPSWCDESIKTLDWVGASQETDANAMRDLYRAQLPGFLERYSDGLADDEQAIIAKVGEVDACPLFEQGDLQDPFSLVHVDYRLDNLLFQDDLVADQAPKITVVDWQSITIGAPLNDVAYFLGAGMLPQARAASEEDIVRAYHAGLLAEGVTQFDWDTCWHNYRRGAFAGFGVTVVASMLVQRTERGDAMFTTMAQRHARHAIDLGSHEFLV